MSGFLAGFVHAPDLIMIDPGYFVPTTDAEANQLSIRLVGHEFIHRYDMDVRERQFWKPLSQTLGGHGYLQTAAVVRDRIAKIGTEGLQPAEALAADRLTYGFGADHVNYAEAVASMGEVYFFGENFFKHGMSLYLGRETASNVYGILRDEIFCGKEYDTFPKIC